MTWLGRHHLPSLDLPSEALGHQHQALGGDSLENRLPRLIVRLFQTTIAKGETTPSAKCRVPSAYPSLAAAFNCRARRAFFRAAVFLWIVPFAATWSSFL